MHLNKINSYTLNKNLIESISPKQKKGFYNYSQQYYPSSVSIQHIHFQKGKQNFHNNNHNQNNYDYYQNQNHNQNNQSLSSSSQRSGYKQNQQLRQSVHQLLKEMESALYAKNQKKSIQKYYQKKGLRQSLQKSPISDHKRMLSTMEIGSYQRRKEDLKTDRSKQNQNKGFQNKKQLNIQKQNENFNFFNHTFYQTNQNKIKNNGLGYIQGFIKIRSLNQLQVSIAQQILMLRQQKITLMQKKNHIIDKKSGVFRQVTKLKRKVDKQFQKQKQILQKQHQKQQTSTLSQKIIALQDQNQYLKNKVQQHQQILLSMNSKMSLQEIKKNQNDQERLLLEIQKYESLCKSVEEQLKKREKKHGIDASRIEAFLPTQSKNIDHQFHHHRHHSNFSSVTKSISKKYNSLQQPDSPTRQKLWNYQTLIQLKRQNQQLMNQANTIIAQKRNSHVLPNVNILQQIVQLDRIIKQGFFDQVRSYKVSIPKLKEENMKMKRIFLQNKV